MASVGIDLDGVVYDFKGTLSKLLVVSGMSHCTMESAGEDWYFYRQWNLTDADFLRCYEYLVDAGKLLWMGEVLDNAVEAIGELYRRHLITIITDRSIGKDAKLATETWLRRHEIDYDRLIISPDKTCVYTDYFVDDKLDNYDALDAAGTEVYLVNRSWNQVPGGDDRRRVSSIGEFAQIVLDKENTHAA